MSKFTFTAKVRDEIRTRTAFINQEEKDFSKFLGSLFDSPNVLHYLVTKKKMDKRSSCQ